MHFAGCALVGGDPFGERCTEYHFCETAHLLGDCLALTDLLTHEELLEELADRLHDQQH